MRRGGDRRVLRLSKYLKMCWRSSQDRRYNRSRGRKEMANQETREKSSFQLRQASTVRPRERSVGVRFRGDRRWHYRTLDREGSPATLPERVASGPGEGVGLGPAPDRAQQRGYTQRH